MDTRPSEITDSEITDSEITDAEQEKRMTPKYLAEFLVGKERAILALAKDRRSLSISILLVLAAALARRYDRVYLLAEPWHLVMPLLVSWVNGSILCGLLAFCFLRKSESRPPRGEVYRVCLTLFWLTAPLAFLYAIPVERFLDPYAAAVANLSLLGVVAIWRVLLYTRAISVVIGLPFSTLVFPVVLFADAITLGFLLLSPKPIVAVMGGVMHSPVDRMIVEVGTYALMLCVITAPIWLVMAIGFGWGQGAKSVWRALEDGAAEATRGPSPSVSSRRGLSAALVCLAIWIPILPFTQAEQRLAWQVDRALVEGRIEEALGILSEHDREDFPPHFDPRPRFWFGAESPSVWRVLAQLDAERAPSWVTELYMEKARRSLRSTLLHIRGTEEHLFWARAALAHPEVAQWSLEWRSRDWGMGTDIEPGSELEGLLLELDRLHVEAEGEEGGAESSGGKREFRPDSEVPPGT